MCLFHAWKDKVKKYSCEDRVVKVVFSRHISVNNTSVGLCEKSLTLHLLCNKSLLLGLLSSKLKDFCKCMWVSPASDPSGEWFMLSCSYHLLATPSKWRCKEKRPREHASKKRWVLKECIMKRFCRVGSGCILRSQLISTQSFLVSSWAAPQSRYFSLLVGYSTWTSRDCNLQTWYTECLYNIWKEAGPTKTA